VINEIEKKHRLKNRLKLGAILLITTAGALSYQLSQVFTDEQTSILPLNVLLLGIIVAIISFLAGEG